MDKMRDEFDKAFGVVFEKIEMTPDVAENTRNTMLQLYSAGWYDSRAALVVDLPLTIKSESGYCTYDALDVHSMLDAAGVRYD